MLGGAEITLGIGAILVGIGLPLGLSFPYLFSSVLQLQLQLGPNSATFKEWSESPIPIYMDIYLWNWTNAADFVANTSIKPEFTEVGPFVFEVKTERVGVTWNDNNTVSFSPDRTFLFRRNKSLSLDTPITALSPVPAVIAYYTRFWSGGFFSSIISKEIDIREKIYQTETAGNWLFYGINDTLLDLIVPLKDIASLPLPFDKFAWFYGRNASSSAEGSFTIFTGSGDLSNLGRISLWNGKNETNAYTGECAQVNGFTGEVLPPMKERPQTLPVFSADVCSKVSLEYLQEVEQFGVKGWEYVGSSFSLDNGELYAENECFCQGDCVPSGARNISECKFGAPAFVSYPHYYLANETYSNLIDGMQPNKSEHEFSLKFEPTTGIPLGVRAQLQINLLMTQSKSMALYADLPEIYFPMLWFRERADITEDIAELVSLVISLPTIGLAVCYSIAAAGFITFITSAVMIRKKNMSKKTINTD